MITSKTVLVLGAGASAHCGYLLGQGLYSRIYENLSLHGPVPSSTENNFRGCGPDVQLRILGYSAENLRSFQKSLVLADRSSIDKFLERRPELREIGKVCIAQALIPFENYNQISSIRPYQMDFNLKNWYQQLFSELDTNFEEFLENNLSVITFNYDRSFEHYLFDTVKHTYGIKDDIAIKLVNSIPVVHVHGQLGKLPWQDKSGREYHGLINTKKDLISASENIKIIHEDIEKDPEFQTAKELIHDADIVHFLGFGYDVTNLERLGVECSIKDNYHGTCQGLSRNQEQKAKNFFNFHKRQIDMHEMEISDYFNVTGF